MKKVAKSPKIHNLLSATEPKARGSNPLWRATVKKLPIFREFLFCQRPKTSSEFVNMLWPKRNDGPFILCFAHKPSQIKTNTA